MRRVDDVPVPLMMLRLKLRRHRSYWSSVLTMEFEVVYFAKTERCRTGTRLRGQIVDVLCYRRRCYIEAKSSRLKLTRLMMRITHAALALSLKTKVAAAAVNAALEMLLKLKKLLHPHGCSAFVLTMRNIARMLLTLQH